MDKTSSNNLTANNYKNYEINNNSNKNITSSDNEDKELVYNEELGFQNIGKLFDDNAEYPLLYEIEIKIKDFSTNNPVYIKVDLEKISYIKPDLGGYVEKNSGINYFNAYGQTDQYKNDQIIKNSRHVQTHYYTTRSTKTNREFGSQTNRNDLYIDSRTDIIVNPTKYFNADEWDTAKLRCSEYINKRLKGFLSRIKAAKYRKEVQDEKDERERKEEIQRKKEEQENNELIERRTHPKKPSDFLMLRKELDEWVKKETEKIKSSNLKQEQKTLALQELLHKEISLLETIKKLKISAVKENNAERIEQFLSKMSKDKEYKMYDGNIIKMSTVFTQIAGKLEEQFKNLNSSTSVDIRMRNLMEFKNLMLKYEKDNKCSLIKEIIELIERETDMLSRNRPDNSLVGLRQRLNNKFLNFIEIPKFNNEAAAYQKIPRDWLADLYKKKK